MRKRCLTPRELQVLDAIRSYRAVHGYSPTLADVARQFGVSRVTVFQHAQSLLKKGRLRRESGFKRNFVPVDGKYRSHAGAIREAVRSLIDVEAAPTREGVAAVRRRLEAAVAW